MSTIFRKELAMRIKAFNKNNLHEKLSPGLLDSLKKACQQTAKNCKKIDVEYSRIIPRPDN